MKYIVYGERKYWPTVRCVMEIYDRPVLDRLWRDSETVSPELGSDAFGCEGLR